MKKRNLVLILSVGVLAFFNIAASNDVIKIAEHAVNTSKSSTLAIQGTEKRYSLAFPTKQLGSADKIAVMYKVAGTSPGVNLFFEESYDRPSVEGTTDSAYLITKVLDSNITSTTFKMATIDLVNMTYGRFYAIGTAGNGTNTTLEIIYAK